MYGGRIAVSTTEYLPHNMAGSSLGPILHGASILMFIAGLTSLIVSLGHLRSKPESRDDSDDNNPRRRVPRTLERLRPEDVYRLYHQGIFSSLINSTLEDGNEALLVLLPALEKFENVMVEESRLLRTALQEHDMRIQNLETLSIRQGDESVRNTQDTHSNRVGPRKARIKVSRSKAQNEVLKTNLEAKGDIVLKETLRKTSVDVEIERNETYPSLPLNDSVVVEGGKGDTLLENDTLSYLKDDILYVNDTVSENDTLVLSDSSVDTFQNTNEVIQNETLVSVQSDSSFQNDTDVFYNETVSAIQNETLSTNVTELSVFDSVNSSSSINSNATEAGNRTLLPLEIPFEGNVTFSPDNTTMDSGNSTLDSENTTIGSGTEMYETLLQLPVTTQTVTMTTPSTTMIASTVRPTVESLTLEKTVIKLQEKVSKLEKRKSLSDNKKWSAAKKKMKLMEKNLAEMKRRYRKMKSKVNSHNSKISSLTIMQGVAYSGMPGDMMKEYEAKKATVLRFDKLERRLINYRDMVIRNRHEIRDLKGLAGKHEHYISELQAGSDRFEHKGREMTTNMHLMEANMDNLFNSLNGYVSDIRWELRVMLDRLCGDNHLSC